MAPDRGRAWVGTSGWQYDDWKDIFYEGRPKSRWLRHYVTRFPTVEVNASFYRLLSRPAVERWRDQTPRGFVYALKGSKFITHNLKLSRPHPAVERFFEPAEPLLPHVPVVLWQLPPRWKRNPVRLDEFLAELPSGPRYAVEFREESWLHDEVFEVLRRHRASHCWLSYRYMPLDLTETADFHYVRFHGLGEDPYWYDYSDDELAPWAERLRAAAEAGCDSYVYFNNDWHGNALRNGHRLMEMLGEVAVPAPSVEDEQ